MKLNRRVSALLLYVYVFFSILSQGPFVCAAERTLVDDFYDSRVSNQQFLANAKVGTAAELKSILPTLFRKRRSHLFSTVGAISSFDDAPHEYGVVHAINYYIPKSYRADGSTALLVILHGGGSSTSRYETARDVSRIYMQDFIGFAERNGVVLVGPSSSVGWSYVTRILISRTIDLAQRELAIDPDRVYLWGHSMGAMGLTRETHWLVSLGAVFLPNAGGMPKEFRIDPFFRTYFNTRVIHTQGLNDREANFLSNTRAEQARMGRVEALMGKKSGYEVIFENHDHDYDITSVVAKLEGEVLKTARNKYQSSLYPLVGRLDVKNSPLGPDVKAYSQSRYFWIETPKITTDLPPKEFAQGKGENFVAFEAQVKNNIYEINIADPRISELRVLISERLVDLSKPVSIKVNGQMKFRGFVAANPLRMLEILRSRSDRSYIFENYVDVPLDFQ